MIIADCCKRDVVVAERDTTVAQAAKLMRKYHVGDVVVVDSAGAAQRPLGIVTDRDIVVEVVALGVDPCDVKLGELVTGRLACVAAADTHVDAIRMMAANAVRRMPVVDAMGSLVGIVTADDLLPQVAAELSDLSLLSARSRDRELVSRQ